MPHLAKAKRARELHAEARLKTWMHCRKPAIAGEATPRKRRGAKPLAESGSASRIDACRLAIVLKTTQRESENLINAKAKHVNGCEHPRSQQKTLDLESILNSGPGSTGDRPGRPNYDGFMTKYLLLAYRRNRAYISFLQLSQRTKQSESRSHDAGWSSLVARRAHNPEVVGSNPAPATSNPRSQARACDLFLYLDPQVVPKWSHGDNFGTIEEICKTKREPIRRLRSNHSSEPKYRSTPDGDPRKRLGRNASGVTRRRGSPFHCRLRRSRQSPDEVKSGRQQSPHAGGASF